MADNFLDQLIEAAKLGMVPEIKAIIQAHPELVHERDETGATALHYAAFDGHRDAVRVLVEAGANINATDVQFGGTPAGWAIEYLREMGGFLAIELTDFAWAIENGHSEFAIRMVKRFPALLNARDATGRPFRELAAPSATAEIRSQFADALEPNSR